MMGVEAAGLDLDSGKHAATLTKGEVLHGAMSYLLQDDDGQSLSLIRLAQGFEPSFQIGNLTRPFYFYFLLHFICFVQDYPGVGPEHSFLKEKGRAQYYCITDEEALKAFKRFSRLEGIIPALETSHALALFGEALPSTPRWS